VDRDRRDHDSVLARKLEGGRVAAAIPGLGQFRRGAQRVILATQSLARAVQPTLHKQTILNKK
jgi:hypothetical protein